MLTEHSVAEAARTAGLTAPARYVEVTGSTNTDLLQAARGGAPAWTVLVAGRQTEGRGRLGRTWTSPAGSSLHVSVLLRPDLPGRQAPLLSLAAAVAMAEACETAHVDVRCKWPNDLRCRDRKLGGVLSEASVQGGRLGHVVVGTGVNLTQTTEDFPPELRGSAISVAMAGGDPDGSSLLTTYLSRLKDWAAAPSGPELLTVFRSRCETLGRTVRAATPYGDVEGVAVDITDAGELVVTNANGTYLVGYGEIVHIT
ncbi:MAG TPA: biotin--[acetyl-CoA-carboxylase] ligase [Actinobacteria bacterium]|jgi:BirA family biotin operon repressor/biotin-[acetyl-CoA-carboxylase] ligase|nr:biotin--[acetyl-CoA-carboxylase] ligase [Actinomycetota bacterium]